MKKFMLCLLCLCLFSSCTQGAEPAPERPVETQPPVEIPAPEIPPVPEEVPVAEKLDYSTVRAAELSFSGEVYLTENGSIFSTIGSEEASLVPLEKSIQRIITDPNTDSVYAFAEDGGIFAWGSNYFRTLYERDEPYLDEPVKIDFPFQVTKLSHSSHLLTVMDEKGQLYGCGDITNDFNEDSSKQYPVKNTELTLIWDDSKGTVADFHSGEHCRIVLTDSGEVYMQGVLAMENNFPFYEDFTKVEFLETIIKVRPISWGMVALSDSGSLYFCGIDTFAIAGERQSGKNSDSYYEPIKVKKLEGLISDFESTGSIVVRTKDHQFYIWGYNSFDFIKEGEAEYISEPFPLELPENIRSFRRGVYSGTAISEDGKLYFWDKNGLVQP